MIQAFIFPLIFSDLSHSLTNWSYSWINNGFLRITKDRYISIGFVIFFTVFYHTLPYYYRGLVLANSNFITDILTIPKKMGYFRKKAQRFRNSYIEICPLQRLKRWICRLITVQTRLLSERRQPGGWRTCIEICMSF